MALNVIPLRAKKMRAVMLGTSLRVPQRVVRISHHAKAVLRKL
jgi:hypothetical protein